MIHRRIPLPRVLQTARVRPATDEYPVAIGIERVYTFFVVQNAKSAGSLARVENA